MGTNTFNPHLLSPYLSGFGIGGAVALLVATGLVLWNYRDSRVQSFNWYLRNWRLKQISAVACLFFVAMAASSWVILDAWGWVYLLVAFKTGTWWFRRALSQRA
jgi:hypothetical protein